MTWIKADCQFEHRVATFFVTYRQMLMEKTVFDLLATAEGPDALERAVLDLIAKYRPELAGCCVYYMGFDPSYNEWRFNVSHSSLPKVAMWSESPRRPLDPFYEKDLQSTERKPTQCQ